MAFIDENFQLHFKTKDGFEVIFNDKLLEQVKNLDNSSLPENTKTVQSFGPFFEKAFMRTSCNFLICAIDKYSDISFITVTIFSSMLAILLYDIYQHPTP